MNVTEQKISELAQQLGEHLKTHHITLATAESCTGGWIAKIITDLPGSSEWFEGSIVSYSNHLKKTALDVPTKMLETFGAVSSETVKAMTGGIFNRTTADIAASVSGIAGPDGGSDEKPVGTVWICWGTRGADLHAEVFQFKGNREAIRLQSVEQTLLAVMDLVGCGKK